MTFDKTQNITDNIYILRNKKVILNTNLAKIYNTTQDAIEREVSNNMALFPDDLCFKLNQNDLDELNAQHRQTNTTESLHKGCHRAFSEHSAYALSFILRTKNAIANGIRIVRAFEHQRRFIQA